MKIFMPFAPIEAKEGAKNPPATRAGVQTPSKINCSCVTGLGVIE